MPGVDTGGYGSPACDKVNLNKVITRWPDMLRVAGSLVTGQVRAYDLLRTFGGLRPLRDPAAADTDEG